MILFQAPTRILAFVGKELVEVVRRPGAIVSLILGPFLIMALFGFGYNGFRRPLEVALVIPQGSGLPTEPTEYESLAGPGLHLASISADQAAAETALREHRVDLVVVAPSKGEESLRQGERSTIMIIYDLVDPVEEAYTLVLAERLEAEVNREIIQRVAGEGQAYVVASVEAADKLIPPEVIASPTNALTQNVSPTPANLTAYYSPAVLALIIQHMAVSLVAISLVREGSTGIMEIFRVSPVSAAEIILGKLLAFAILNGAIAVAIIALLVNVLNVPLLGDTSWLAGTVALLVVASLGLGMVIALLADSERQAVQLTLLVLLASVFFSGLVIGIDEFRPEVRTAAYALPVTHGIQLIQDVMLRGSISTPWQAGALAAIGALLVVSAWMLLRIRMTRA
jgi:ABC-2 type transport system permease protein